MKTSSPVSGFGALILMECACDGDHIQVILNGTLVNEAFGASPRSGKILLQCEGSEIFFRGMELRPVKAVASSRRRNGE